MPQKTLHKIAKVNMPRWLVLIFDVYIVLNTFLVAYFIRFNFHFNFNFYQFVYQLPIVATVTIIVFLSIGSYKGIIAHTGLKDAKNVFLASFFIALVLALMVYANRYFQVFETFTIPVSIIAIHFLLNVVFLFFNKYLFKSFYDTIIENPVNKNNILIYGAGAMGLITNTVLTKNNNNLKNIGFIDDDIKKSNRVINGIKVYHATAIDATFLRKKKIRQIIVAIQKIKPSRIQEIVKKYTEFNIEIKIVPPVSNWLEENLKENQIKQVNIEDLLGRDTIELKNPKLGFELSTKVIVITGAAGSIGSELARQLSKFNFDQLVLIDQAESALYDLQQYFIHKNCFNITAIVADVKDKKRMNAIFKKYSPNYIYHAAAYKHVPFMEENPYEAVKINVAGTKIIADLAVKYHAEKFIMISTDKAVNPTNIMGATKRIAELYINCMATKNNTKFITTRFGNVLGSNGSVIPLLKRQLESGGPLTVTHKDITRFFMTIPEACQLVLEAGSMGNGGEIFVFDMGESVKIFELAQNMIRLSGLKYPEDIDIKIIGLRPGEKIFEELLADGENVLPTHHEKIMIAKSNGIDKEATLQKIEALIQLNHHSNYYNTVYKMKELLPEFISNNSEYEKLDDNYVN